MFFCRLFKKLPVNIRSIWRIRKTWGSNLEVDHLQTAVKGESYALRDCDIASCVQ